MRNGKYFRRHYRMMIKNVMAVLVGGISIPTASSAQADEYGYPKENAQLRQILSPAVPIEEVKKNAGGFFDLYDHLWQDNAEIPEKDLLNLYYAAAGNTALMDWTCNARGDILAFVEDDEFGCIITTFYVFRKSGGRFRRVGVYRFVSRFLRPVPANFLIEDDGISLTASRKDSGATQVSVTHKFYFSSPQESFYIFCGRSDDSFLNGIKR